jgi:hypothetical protein
MEVSPRRGSAAATQASGVQRELVARRPHGEDASPDLRSEPRADRRADRIAAAERVLLDACAHVKRMGVDPDAVNTAFAVLRDCIAEAKECSALARRELALAQHERDQVRRRLLHLDTRSTPVVPDIPGLGLCPDPGAVKTSIDFMETLRMYRLWAGKPSYRVMEHRCARRFAASTIYTALRSNDLPSLDMVQAIITACCGRDEHLHAFASAWRRLVMEQKDTSRVTEQPPRERPLYPMSKPA